MLSYGYVILLVKYIENALKILENPIGLTAIYTDRNFVDKCSQQVMHFDHEATY